MNMGYLVYLITLMVLFNVNASDNTTTNDNETSRLFDNTHVSVSIATGCFSSDTLITLADRQQIPISQLRSGHQLLTTEGTHIVHTEMMMMLDQNRLSSAMFHTIVTASGDKISLTGLHLIATITDAGEVKYRSAKDVKEGDSLRVVSDGEVYSSVVNNVTMEMKRGYHAPLTMTGTLLANGILASCFSNVENHELVQLYLSPLRWYYRISRWLLIKKPFGDEMADGIHNIAQLLYEFVQSIYPSILRFE